ncbi:14840_t:CDS:2 [Entrophospora sp. SA101]|nr:14840_t:CDS:2 [Entrophospora sp. SA101]
MSENNSISRNNNDNTRKKNAKKNTKPATTAAIEDPRFAHSLTDPRFRRPKKKDMKITVDERFSDMLNSKEFGVFSKFDKRGRLKTIDDSAKELKRYYNLDDDQLDVSDSSSSPSEDDDVSDILSSDSSSSGDDDEPTHSGNSELIEEEEQITYGEETLRLAVINMDWDNIKSADLMKVFATFVPKGSLIKSVKIYPSEFGKKRLDRETVEGPPKEIFKKTDDSNLNESGDDSNDDDNDGEVTEKNIINVSDGKEFDEDALRKYQLERLKYYYAVVDCDSVKTAKCIYQNCDGVEFESTGNFFDLRFIPDDVEFNDLPKDECYQVPDVYKPVDFVTDALQHSNVKLTWDNDDPDRVKIIKQKFSKNDLELMDFKSYLASSSEEEESDNEVEEARQKYKDLLIDLEKNKSDEDQDIQITFAPGLSESATLNDSHNDSDDNEDEMLLGINKNNSNKEEKKILKQQGKLLENNKYKKNKEKYDSDDDEITKTRFNVTKLSKKKSKKNTHKLSKLEQQEADRNRAELELLLMDDEDNLVGDGDVQQEENDNFEIDLEDTRFVALHDSYHFAIDPTSPQYPLSLFT